MQLGEVIGTVVATEKTPNLDGVKFLIVQPLTRAQEPAGRPVVDRVTGARNPWYGARVRVKTAEPGAQTATEGGSTVTRKSRE